jgi:hypothetical protein
MEICMQKRGFNFKTIPPLPFSLLEMQIHLRQFTTPFFRSLFYQSLSCRGKIEREGGG